MSNRDAERWVSRHRGASAEMLGQAIDAGFLLIEVGGEPCLVWGGDADRIEDAIAAIPDSKPEGRRRAGSGEACYRAREAGASWGSIASATGKRNPCNLARVWARVAGEPWPIPVSRVW